MIGVNPPGHFLWDAKTTDEQIRRYVDAYSKDKTCSKRTSQPRGIDEGDRGRHTRPLVLSADQGREPATCASRPSTGSRNRAAGERPPFVTDDARLMALRGRGRCERVLIPIAPGRWPSHGIRLGRVCRRREGRRPSGERLLLLRRAGAQFEPRLCGNGVRLGRRPPDRWLARRAGRGRLQPGADVER